MKFIPGEKFLFGWESLIWVEAESVTFQSYCFRFRFHRESTASTTSASSFRFRFHIPGSFMDSKKILIWLCSRSRSVYYDYYGHHYDASYHWYSGLSVFLADMRLPPSGDYSARLTLTISRLLIASYAETHRHSKCWFWYKLFHCMHFDFKNTTKQANSFRHFVVGVIVALK